MRPTARGARAAVTAAVVVLVAVGSASCSFDVDDAEAGVAGSVPQGCAAVDVAASPEKYRLLATIAQRFNATSLRGDDCAFVRVYEAPSGETAQRLADGWRNGATLGPRPVIWSPSASAWGAILEHQLAQRGRDPLIDLRATVSFANSPLVIAMPQPMAEALGWPATPIGFADLVELATDPAGWASRGHPEWGPFKLAKASPTLATSGLSATIAQYYGASGRQADLTAADVERPEVAAAVKAVESAVIHYGSSTRPFLENLARHDRDGDALDYVSALLVEEQSVVDYNRAAPSGFVAPGATVARPAVPLVAIPPKEGTLVSDNPLFVLDARWVSSGERAAAQRFQSFALSDESQRAALDLGFRPASQSVAAGTPLVPENGVDPNRVVTILPVPHPSVVSAVLRSWQQQKKQGTVLLVIDVSGSMGEEVGGGQTKLDMARRAIARSLRTLDGGNLLAARAFSTGIGPDGRDHVDLGDFAPAAISRSAIRDALDELEPEDGTALLRVVESSVDRVTEVADPSRINSVIVLTDGRNEDDYEDIGSTLRLLRDRSGHAAVAPVRLFTIAYGGDADRATLQRLAAATDGASYDASDPGKITTVLTAVFSNF
jgi:Ca-activated chloride channel homolog